MTELEHMRQAMVEALKAGGVHAIGAWPAERRLRHAGPVVAVSLRQMRREAVGFRDYLGERYDPGRDCWSELYGQKLELVFGLDIYAGQPDGCAAAFDRLANALAGPGPAWFRQESLHCGEALYREEAGCFCCPAELRGSAWIYVQTDTDGQLLTDFELKGRLPADAP